MVGTVSVIITEALSQTKPSGAQVEYEVRNETQAPIWLVNDGWLIWYQVASQIELSYVRGKMRSGIEVFGYFPPSVFGIEHGSAVIQVVQLVWPQSLDRLWNPERWAAPPPGQYQVAIRVGYGLTPEPDDPDVGERVEAPVFRWQKEAVSQAVPLEVFPYESTQGSI